MYFRFCYFSLVNLFQAEELRGEESSFLSHCWCCEQDGLSGWNPALPAEAAADGGVPGVSHR